MYEFIRRRFHARIKSNAFEKIRVCKIPWMILHNDTRIKSYTYEKLHVWKITRMKSYTYWILSSDWCIVLHVWILSRNFWYALRFIHVAFYTCNLWRILSTSVNHKFESITSIDVEFSPLKHVGHFTKFPKSWVLHKFVTKFSWFITSPIRPGSDVILSVVSCIYFLMYRWFFPNSRRIMIPHKKTFSVFVQL